MRKEIGKTVALFLYYTGLIAFARWRMQQSGRRLIILNYHRAIGGDLRRHLRYLRRHYRMMHLEDALRELYATPTEYKRPEDRRTPLVLTFDDGHRDNYTIAFTLAQELRVPITIFLIPGYVESGDYFWWMEGKRLARRAGVKEVTLEGSIYHLDQPADQEALARFIDTQLRFAKSVTEREAFLSMVREKLAVPATVAVEDEISLPVNWMEVHEMEESGYVSFGAHTMHHPILSYLADPEELRNEVSECRTALEQKLGHPVLTFAYPVGRHEHIGGNTVQAVQDAGYEWAVTTLHGVNTSQGNPYLLNRVLGDVSRHWVVMAAETSGIWKLLAPLWQSVIGKGPDV